MSVFDFSPKKPFTNADEKRMVEAIIRVENLTSGEIRVHFQAELSDDIYDAAIKKFEELGMHNTDNRNGVLLFIAYKSRKFAIVGDSGINEKVPVGFWDTTKDKMAEYFKSNQLINGVIEGINSAGEQLARVFPGSHHHNENELSNDISYDE